MPTERAKLLELAEWCEAAEGPDRELDAQIWLACVPGSTRSELRYWHAASGKECVIDETRQADGRLIVVPAYSASIDAALSLAKANWLVGFKELWDGKAKAANAFIDLYTVKDDGLFWGEHIQACAATPALAITAASLRARATENRHD